MGRKLTATAVALMTVMGATALLLVAPVPALAQVGSGIGQCTANVGTQDVGTVTIGQRFVLQVAPSCVFTAGASVTVTVNGVNVGGKVANENGFVNVTITVVSATQLSVEDPVITPARCGTNTVVVTGPSAVSTSGSVTQTANFTLVCPATPVATVTQGRLSLTGANVAKWGAVALALLVAGSFFVVAGRRRTSATR